MTPQERQLIEGLFDRLASVDTTTRDPDAMAAIAEGLRRAPNAVYTLIQTVLIQDEALARANQRIEELERPTPAAPAQPGSFLDSMRDAVFGQGAGQGTGQPQARSSGSVPRSGGAPPQPASWNTGDVLNAAGNRAQNPQPDARFDPRGAPPPAGGGAGSFLGTAAAAAAGVVGGSLLMNSIRGMMGGGEKPQSVADASGADKSNPWGSASTSDSSKGDLAKDAGADDVGKADNNSADNASDNGGFDQASYEDDDDFGMMDDGYDDFDDTDFG